MRAGLYLLMTLLALSSGCTKFEDADMSERNTFVHFFSSETSYHGIVAELDTDGGYIISGEIRKSSGEPDALIIKTDARGHKIWEQVISKSLVNAIKPHQGGYILVGDSLQINSGSIGVDLSELENTYARLMKMNAQGTVIAAKTMTGRSRVGTEMLTIDYHGNAFDIDADGNIVVLGSYRTPGQPQAAFISTFDPADIRDSLRYQPYAFEQDVVNSNAIHATATSSLVWASSIQNQVGNLTRKFIGVSQVAPNSTFARHRQFGASDQRNHSVMDIQKSPVGYCAIGTYAETNGLNGNIYFVHMGNGLDVLTERYIDGEELMLRGNVLESNSRTLSNSLDEGLAVISTHDGFVLAGTITSTPTVGNGGKDILLIKLDASGNLLWRRIIGGSGDETVRSIRVTADDGLLLCGTNTVNGLSTIMLVKTDKYGNLDN